MSESMEITEDLRDAADLAVKAGVRPTVTEWLSMNPAERIAFADAAEKKRCELIARFGLAAQDGLAALEEFGAIDGGDAFAEANAHMQLEVRRAEQKRGAS